MLCFNKAFIYNLRAYVIEDSARNVQNFVNFLIYLIFEHRWIWCQNVDNVIENSVRNVRNFVDFSNKKHVDNQIVTSWVLPQQKFINT